MIVLPFFTAIVTYFKLYIHYCINFKVEKVKLGKLRKGQSFLQISSATQKKGFFENYFNQLEIVNRLIYEHAPYISLPIMFCCLTEARIKKI